MKYPPIEWTLSWFQITMSFLSSSISSSSLSSSLSTSLLCLHCVFHHSKAPCLGSPIELAQGLRYPSSPDHCSALQSHLVNSPSSWIPHIHWTNFPHYHLPHLSMNHPHYDNGTAQSLSHPVRTPSSSLPISCSNPRTSLSQLLFSLTHILPHSLWHLVLSYGGRSRIWFRWRCHCPQPVFHCTYGWQ